MKINKKGFAISTILYGMLLMTMLILGGLLTTLHASKRSNDLLIDEVEDYLNQKADEYVKNRPSFDPKCFIFDASTGTITDYLCHRTHKDVIIPDMIDGVKVVAIGEKAFWGGGTTFNVEATINSVVIPEGVRSIKEFAFAYNNIKTITVPSTVTSIGRCAFFRGHLNPGSNPDLETVVNLTGRGFYFERIIYCDDAENPDHFLKTGVIFRKKNYLQVTITDH